MPEPLTVEEFKSLLGTKSAEDVVQDVVFEREPHVFRDEPDSLQLLREHVIERLKVFAPSLAATDCQLVGSAQTGFSLAPDSFPNSFSEESDIDVAIVSAELFDKIWLTILRWNYAYPRRHQLEPPNQAWVRARRHDIYWGWFRPDEMKWTGLWRKSKLTAVQEVRAAWFNTFRELGLYREFAGRDVHGRLYRTWEHAVEYHADGVRKIAKSLGIGGT